MFSIRTFAPGLGAFMNGFKGFQLPHGVVTLFANGYVIDFSHPALGTNGTMGKVKPIHLAEIVNHSLPNLF